MITDIVSGLINVFHPISILIMIASLSGGVVVGTLPGLSATMGVALLVPLTFGMDPALGLLMLGGMYVGAIYGGSNSAILINTPGTPSAICTTFDGFPMTKMGKPLKAMSIALLASAFGGIIGNIFLFTATEPLAKFSLRFGPPEYFWLAIFGLTIISSLSRENFIKGILSGSLGLLIATIGIDLMTGHERFTFGINALTSGINNIAIMIGIFAFSQVLILVDENESYIAKTTPQPGVVLETAKELISKFKLLLLRSSLIGTIVGIMPGAGGNIAAFVAYDVSKNASKEPEAFGKGAMAGIASSESSNNAVCSSSLIPLFALGIPGSPVAAVLMGGLLAHGITPGPKLFSMHADVAYTFILGMFLANLLLIPVGIVGMRIFVRVLNVRSHYIAIVVTVLAVIGSYAIRNSMLDVMVMFISGSIGYFVFKIGLSSGSLILGVILGPIIEKGFSQSLLISNSEGIIQTFFLRPISLVLIVCCIVSVFLPPLMEKKFNKVGDR